MKTCTNDVDRSTAKQSVWIQMQTNKKLGGTWDILKSDTSQTSPP